ncbi:MAG: tyrosine-type recombinase/integrase, partial [Acidobacteriota bacterium]
MARRRAPGEGSIRKRKDGRWEWSLPVGRTYQGNPKRVSVYARTRTALLGKIEQRREELAAGGLVLPDSITVRAFLERWLEGKGRSCRASTLRNYRETVDRWILPVLGDHRLQRVTALDVHRLLAGMEATVIRRRRRRRDAAGQTEWVVEERPLAVRTVRYVHGLLVDAFGQAVSWRLMAMNPASAVSAPPPAARPSRLVWSRDEVRAFLEAARGSRYHAAYVLALSCGLRRGEVLGLRVSDFDRGEGTLRIRRSVISVQGKTVEGEPKTERARRTLYLPPEARTALLERLDALARERVDALSVGAWRGDLDPYLFGTAIGTATCPRNLLRNFASVQRRAGVRRLRFHDLRHTYGSLAVGHVPLPVLSARMGHHRPSYTADVYAHEIPGAGKEAALSL